jgi:hypothetical protein
MFRNGKKVRVKDSVLRKVRIAAELIGCTVEEFIENAVDKEAERALALMPRRESAAPEIEHPVEQQGTL